jgi:hypothetical protein
MRFGDHQHPLAMVSLFSMPDEEILSDSSQSVYLCEALDLHEGLVVIPIMDIYLVIAMFPESTVSEAGDILLTGKFVLMRHAYIKLAPFSSGGLFDKDDDNEGDE